MTSFRARTAFVVPEDGKNLNRCFPGSPDGTLHDVLAHHVFDELIAPSDVLIDLHGGDMVEALEPFTLYDESPVAEEAQAIGDLFRLPLHRPLTCRRCADRRHDQRRGGGGRHPGGDRRGRRLRPAGGGRGAAPPRRAAAGLGSSACCPTVLRRSLEGSSWSTASSGCGRQAKGGGSRSCAPARSCRRAQRWAP